MKQRILGLGVVMALLAMIALAGDPPAQPLATGYIEKFEVPERDADGNLRWKLSGDRAQFGEDGRMIVENMRAEFFQSNQVGLVFSAPQATLDQAQRRASTEAAVRLEAENIVVTGDGAEWSGGDNLFSVHSNVHVVIRGELRPPAATDPAEPGIVTENADDHPPVNPETPATPEPEPAKASTHAESE